MASWVAWNGLQLHARASWCLKLKEHFAGTDGRGRSFCLLLTSSVPHDAITYTHEYRHACTNEHTYVHAYVYIHIGALLHAYSHAYIGTTIRIPLLLCVFIGCQCLISCFTRAYSYVHTYTESMCILVCTYMHIGNPTEDVHAYV